MPPGILSSWDSSFGSFLWILLPGILPGIPDGLWSIIYHRLVWFKSLVKRERERERERKVKLTKRTDGLFVDIGVADVVATLSNSRCPFRGRRRLLKWKSESQLPARYDFLRPHEELHRPLFVAKDPAVCTWNTSSDYVLFSSCCFFSSSYPWKLVESCVCYFISFITVSFMGCL